MTIGNGAERRELGDKAASILRTGIPLLWSVFLTWLATRIPELGELLSHPNTVGLGELLALAVVMMVWYPLWRWLEPRLPDWLVTFVLGYAKQPRYMTPGRTYDRPEIRRQVE